MIATKVLPLYSTFEWETINPSSLYWPYPRYQAGVQSTVTEWNNLGDRGVSDTPHLFWIKEDSLEDGGMEGPEDILFDNLDLDLTKHENGKHH